MAASIIFLDIDGVLLTGNAWELPANKAAVRMMRNRKTMDALESVSFDTEAVRLVVRLAERTDSQIVISSNWRKTVGGEFAKRKLTEQGIPERLFHVDWSTPIVGFRESNKGIEIVDWLDDHRLTPSIEKPERPKLLPPGKQNAKWRVKYNAAMKKYSADYDAWQRSLCNDHGINYVILEDEGYDFRHLRVVDTFYDTGVAAQEYAIAVRALGGEDPEMGVHALHEGDWTRVLAAFEGHAVRASRWLQTASDGSCYAAALRGDESDRVRVWERLAEDTKPFAPRRPFTLD